MIKRFVECIFVLFIVLFVNFCCKFRFYQISNSTIDIENITYEYYGSLNDPLLWSFDTEPSHIIGYAFDEPGRICLSNDKKCVFIRSVKKIPECYIISDAEEELQSVPDIDDFSKIEVLDMSFFENSIYKSDDPQIVKEFFELYISDVYKASDIQTDEIVATVKFYNAICANMYVKMYIAYDVQNMQFYLYILPNQGIHSKDRVVSLPDEYVDLFGLNSLI